MKVVEPSAKVILCPDDPLRLIEIAGRTCYKSEHRITEDSSNAFVRRLISNGHESVLEHVSVTVKIICDRGVSHELVRHRLASYSQESTRYVKYDEIEVIFPQEMSVFEGIIWQKAIEALEAAYKELSIRCSAQVARAVLPTCLKTEVVMTANLREWRHILKLRLSKAAHPDMRFVMAEVLKELRKRVPIVFEDINLEK